MTCDRVSICGCHSRQFIKKCGSHFLLNFEELGGHQDDQCACSHQNFDKHVIILYVKHYRFDEGRRSQPRRALVVDFLVVNADWKNSHCSLPSNRVEAKIYRLMGESEENALAPMEEQEVVA